MAGLNTLRTRGGVIISIVIGVALVSFLLTDFIFRGNMGGGGKLVVGQLGRNKISLADFETRSNYLTEINKIGSNSESLNETQQQNVTNQTWEQLISEIAINPDIEKLGLSVGSAETVDMGNGVYVSPVIMQMFADPSTGLLSREALQEFIGRVNGDPSGRLRMFWAYLQDEMVRQREFEKLQTLISKGVFVTDLEVEHAVAHNASNYSVSYAQQLYSSIADSTVNVSEAAMREFYNKHSHSYKQYASHDVEYVAFDIMPSESDYADAKNEVDKIAAGFAADPEPMQFARMNSQQPVDMGYYKDGQLGAGLNLFAFTASKDSVYGPVLEGDMYTMARIADKKMLPDTVGLRHIMLPVAMKEQADSILKALKGGADFSALAQTYSYDNNTKLVGGDLGKVTFNMLPDIAEPVFNANKGDIFIASSKYATHIVEVTYRGPLFNKVQLAMVKYEVVPSDNTQQGIYAQASAMVTASGNSLEKFSKYVEENGLSRRVARLSASNPEISGLNGSKSVVRWAYNAKKGEVSTVLETSDCYVVAALASVKENGTLPFEEVKNGISSLLIREEKAKTIAAQVNGMSVEQAADQFGVAVKEVSGVNGSTGMIPEIGYDLALAGAITSTEEGPALKPAKGNTGVYVFRIDTKTPVEPAVNADEERVRLRSYMQMYTMERVLDAIYQQGNLKDNRARFF